MAYLVVRNKAAEFKTFVKRIRYIEGRIKSRQWQTEDGTTKHTSETGYRVYFRQRKMLKTTTNSQSESVKKLTLTQKITAYLQ
jgi:single-strand DNA-binding protein